MVAKQKQSVYLPNEMLEEIRHEAHRQDRGISWILTRAWAIARGRVGELSVQPPMPLADEVAQRE